MNWINIIIAVAIFLAIAAIMGIICALASHYFQVKEDERLGAVTSMLPGYNCGACGNPGCSGFAASIVKGQAKSLDACKIVKPDQKEKIKEYLKNTPGPDGTSINL